MGLKTKTMMKILEWKKVIFILGIGNSYIVESFGLAMGQTPVTTPSIQSTVSATPDWASISDSEWLKKVGHMLLQPLSNEEIEMASKQLGFSDEEQTDFLKFVQLVANRDLYGREQGRALEMEATRNLGSELSDKFEKQYEDANQQCLELTQKFRLELGDKQEDLIEWILEMNYFRNVVMDAFYKKDLGDEDDLTNKAVRTIEDSPRFKVFKERKTLKFSTPEDAENYFGRHDLSLRKRMAYQILFIKASEYTSVTGHQEYISKKQALVQEISSIGQ